MMTDRLVLSVAEAAEALGVSDDLVYELTERGELPCLRFGRRKVIPRRAIELLVESAIADFDPGAVLTSLNGAKEQVSRGRTDASVSTPSANDAVHPPAQAGDAPVAVGRKRAPRRRPGAPSRPVAARDRANGGGDVAPLRLFDDGDRDAHNPRRNEIAGSRIWP